MVQEINEFREETLDPASGLGVCCECQHVHPLFVSSTGEVLMAEHDFMQTNLRCNGSGTVPQTTSID